MSSHPRQPPRYVPTLTEVVEAVPSAAVLPDSLPGPQPAMAAQALPLLESEPLMPVAKAQTGLVATDLVNAEVRQLSEQAMERIMARVEAVLEERLRYALADLVQLHTATLYQAMRSEIEDAVRTSVQEAVAQEQLPQPAR